MNYQARKTFTRVKLLDTKEVVDIVDLLSTQMTVMSKGRILFLFYNDRGDTWEMIK